MMCLKVVFALAIIINTTYFALELNDVCFIILSQENSYNFALSKNLTDDIRRQSKELSTNQVEPHILVSYKNFSNTEATWTIFPIILNIANLEYINSIEWVLFLEDRTKINLKLLLNTLSKYDSKEDVWVGQALYDREATIIHHFAFFKDPTFFKYPNIASGFAVSVPLVHRLASDLRHNIEKIPDFHIDVAHELALTVWNKGKGRLLQHEPDFCSKEGPQCASWPIKFVTCDKPVSKNSIYIAIKTCEKFHQDRIKSLKQTWAKHATEIKYFSNSEDPSIPTIDLKIPNTEQGHCAKTMAILKYTAKDIKNKENIKWVVIADDDTILSVSRLHSLLSCYDSTKPIALGERYRYNGYSHGLRYGYDYITGGGGMVFSRVLLERLIESCHCPTASTPDDMQLGLCLGHMGVKITHSPFFHQARPIDYAPEFLDTNDAVSFHKHWMIDPVKVYAKLFQIEDDMFFNGGTPVSNNNLNTHSEL